MVVPSKAEEAAGATPTVLVRGNLSGDPANAPLRSMAVYVDSLALLHFSHPQGMPPVPEFCELGEVSGARLDGPRPNFG